MDSTALLAQPLIAVGRYAEATEPGVHLFRFDGVTGALTAVGAYTGITNPSFLIAHPNRRWLYVASETSGRIPGSVWALRLAGDPPTLEPLNQRPSGGDSPCHLQLDASGKWLLASNYSSGSVAVLPIRADGSLGELTDLQQHHGRGPHPERQEGPHAHSAVFAPDNRFVIVADLGIDQLRLYRFDATAGKLVAHDQVDTQPGAGPRHMAFHPDGRFLYVANELNNTVGVYDYIAADGTLRPWQVIATLPPGSTENIVAHIYLSPSGRHLYVSNRGHDSITVFAAADDEVTIATVAPCGGRWPRHFTPVPGGRFLLVANQHSDEITTLPLLADPPLIGAPVARAAVSRAACVQVITPGDTEPHD